MSDRRSSSNHPDPTGIQTEKRILESVGLFKSAVEDKINRLAQANKRLKQKIFDLYTIFELSRKLNSVLDLDDLLSEMLSTLVDQLGIRNIAIFLRRDPKQDKLSFLKLKGTSPVSSPQTKHWEISTKGELYRLFLTEKESLFLEEIRAFINDDDPEMKILRELDCKLCVPLISREELVGILSLGSKKTDLRFSDSDLEFIFVLADHLTVAVENAILYENQKSVNAELRKTQRQLIQSEKLAALGQLSASLAHEVNNPLGIIKNYLQILSEGTDKSDRDQSSIKTMKDEVNRIARIVRSLLDFSRPEKEEMVVLDLSSVLRESVSLVDKEFLRKKITIKQDLSARLSPVMGDRDQLKQVFLNLLVNSRDFTPEGGEVEVSARNADSGVTIEFSDTGPGIPEENLTRIFEPFFTTKEE
ncbi:MAG: GAF domain-containing protein [Candidatus Zixiibacteriota bacterium]|nr:MAG: GAF domain-containing protein [candidate division Zixibacteria bacterium]